MSEKDLNKLAEEMMVKLFSEGDVEAFTKALRKQFWEVTLEVEMDEHRGRSKHEKAGNGTGNSRNGKAKKRLKSEMGELEIQAPPPTSS